MSGRTTLACGTTAPSTSSKPIDRRARGRTGGDRRAAWRRRRSPALSPRRRVVADFGVVGCARMPAFRSADMEKYARVDAKCASFNVQAPRRWSGRCRSTRRSMDSVRAPRGLHGMSPAKAARCFAGEVETVARHHRVDRAPCNKFLARSLRSRQAARLRGARRHRGGRVLAPKPVTLIFGVGKMSPATPGARRPAHHRGPAARQARAELRRRYGVEGARLARLARGLDDRPVRAEREAKSISAENHLRPRHCRLPSAGAAAVAPRREVSAPAQDPMRSPARP